MRPAVTHDDLSLRKAQERRAGRSGSQIAVGLVALSVLCGLVSFILCLAAEGSRSEVSNYLMTVAGSGAQVELCFYNGSGRSALAFSIGAFLLLAVAMFAVHAYMLLAVASPDSAAAGLAVAEDHPRVSSATNTLTWQTCCLFFVTWICFGLAEVLLMIGIGVESGHVSDWRRPRQVCHRVRPGMFAAAGILGLITVVVGFVVYVTAVHTQKLLRQHGGGHYAPHPGSAPYPSGAPYPGVQQHHLQPPVSYPPHPAPHPHPHPAPNAPEITAAACQVQSSNAWCITKDKEYTDV
ncbi:hypothetical protein CFC21_040948 [Triticum aestivum]|uniref:Uncharacterized protein n=3 Tax=Triticum TaxID=4564 RepID=A0A9R1S0D4_TRITD|nr:uncharacterized protein LOC119275712 [Triticum dicoccoides]XP_044348369.1 uncharacterized protein LOC123069548 [Triticum aestivum]KAF7029124.1 hypothetical protein CFC21_040948 [Triticum aestivum]VAH75649.1 unnamed protein product [Triticum turgidum subsp. durum]